MIIPPNAAGAVPNSNIGSLKPEAASQTRLQENLESRGVSIDEASEVEGDNLRAGVSGEVLVEGVREGFGSEESNRDQERGTVLDVVV